MKLLVDMNLSPRWTVFLISSGFEATHWSTIGPFNATDAEIMAYADKNGFIVLTHDLDFSNILAVTHGRKPSVVQIRADDVSLNAVGKQVVGSLRQMEAELEAGALVTIEPNRYRLRLLPLQEE